MDAIRAIAVFALLCGVCSQTDDDATRISCEKQKKLFDFIQCDGDKFSPLQCKNRYCYCVDEDTGTVIEKKSVFDQPLTIERCRQDDSSCESVICPSDLFCGLGYKKDDSGCEICECKEGCPEVLCALFCKNNFKVGSDGCPICECNEDECNRCSADEVCILNGNDSMPVTCQRMLENNETCKREIDEIGGFDASDDSDGSDSDDTSDDGDGDTDGTSDAGDGNDSKNDTTIPVGKRDTVLPISSCLSDRNLRLLSSDSEDEEKEEKLDEVRGSILGSLSRLAIRTIRTDIVTCQTGFFCERTSITKGRCTRRNDTDECLVNSSNSERDCDNNGFYRQRRCYRTDNGKRECVCVFPNNGTVLENTRTIVEDDTDAVNDDSNDRKLQCRDYIYPSCLITDGEQSYRIKHGETHFDKCNCRSCTCYFGNTCCDVSQDICRRKCPEEPADCTNPDISHGQSFERNCNKCWCRDGNFVCTKINCASNNDTNNNDGDNNNDDDDDECDKCRNQPVRHVCGSNGRTYSSKCAALICHGLAAVDIIDGPCEKYDPCDRFPCDEGEICLRKGGVSCLSRSGCKPNDFRVCVKATSVPCNYTSVLVDDDTDSSDDNSTELGSGDIDPRDTAVCGTDGVSYPFICQIIPRHLKVRVLHAGKCNSRNCRGGPVCGTDGVTYTNICVLRSRSANARVDYRGNCTSNDNRTLIQHCSRVIDEGRCQITSDNCQYLIRPLTGCCPICGSGLIILLDLESLRDAALVIDKWSTLDGFLTDLFDTDFMVTTFEKCRLEVSLTDRGHLEIVFTSSADSRQFCEDRAKFIVEIVDGLVSIRKRQTDNEGIDLPSSYQHVIGAIALTAEADDQNTTDETPGGVAMSTAASFILLSILLIVTKIFN